MNTICPRCGNNETIKVNVDDGDTLTCSGCEEEFTVADVRELVDCWAKLLPWLESHPARQEEPAAV